MNFNDKYVYIFINFTRAFQLSSNEACYAVLEENYISYNKEKKNILKITVPLEYGKSWPPFNSCSNLTNEVGVFMQMMKLQSSCLNCIYFFIFYFLL